jgi:hypothetical protein
LSDSELDYFTDLVMRYVDERIPALTDDKAHIPPIRKQVGQVNRSRTATRSEHSNHAH